MRLHRDAELIQDVYDLARLSVDVLGKLVDTDLRHTHTSSGDQRRRNLFDLSLHHRADLSVTGSGARRTRQGVCSTSAGSICSTSLCTGLSANVPQNSAGTLHFSERFSDFAFRARAAHWASAHR